MALEHNISAVNTNRSFHISIRATNDCRTIAVTETEQEPSMPDTTSTVTGVRRQRQTETFCPREVRQRVNEPEPVDDVVDLDFMLDQESNRFMKEEMAN
ncbi:hypothetical protein PsorP6_000997 [Peronosclerospora sorghi]|uniref:Uncharacterized protein n=1 Tax=Peronosclerospora sorghi TaxID=230839 RepID=A0ACC0WT57_9STRA|nr:hypothetical protein PsorP6_000997 [Peronosclerospora sorghi]